MPPRRITTSPEITLKHDRMRALTRTLLRPGLWVAAAVAATTLGVGRVAPARAQPAEPDARGAPTRPAEVERADAFLTSAVVNRLIQTLLPIPLDVRGNRAAGVPAARLSVDEARYCGTTSGGQGRIVVIVRKAAAPATARDGATAATPASVLGDDGDCALKLRELAARAGGDAGVGAGADALAVADVLAAWTPSRLRIVLGEVAASRDGAAVAEALARAKAAGPLATVETGALGATAARGVALGFAVSLSFPAGRDGVWIAAVPSEHGPPPREARAAIDPATLPGGGEAQVIASAPLANRLIGAYAQDGPLVLKMDNQTIEVRDLELGAAEGALAVRGRATSRELRETLRLTIDSAGADLKVVKVHAQPEPESCEAMSALARIGCRARNTARSAAAATAAGALTDRYRGQLLRNLSSPPATSIDVDGLHFNVRLVPTRVQSLAGAVSITGRIEIDRP